MREMLKCKVMLNLYLQALNPNSIIKTKKGIESIELFNTIVKLKKESETLKIYSNIISNELTSQYDNVKKYLSSNPLIKLIINKFLKDVNRLIQLTEAHYILDLGCGEGFVSKYLKAHNKGIRIQGLDISLKALKIAKRLGAL